MRTLAIFCALGLTGCAAQAPIVTPTGRPEIMIEDATPGEIASELATACAATLHGNLAQTDEHHVTCDGLRPVGLGERLLIALASPSYCSHSVDRAEFSLLQIGPRAVRVIANRRVTIYGCFGPVNEAEVHAADQQLQEVLETVAGIISAAHRAGARQAATLGFASPAASPQ